MPKQNKQDGLYKRPDSPYIWATYTDASDKRIRRSTQTTDEKEAEAILANWKLESHKQRMWGVAPQRTFDELMVKYLNKVKHVKKSYPKDLDILAVMKPYFTGKILNNLSASDVEQYITIRQEMDVSLSSIRRELSLLSVAINHANAKWEWGLPNPVMRNKPPAGEGRIRWITHSLAHKLIVAAKSRTRAPYLGDFIELSLYTGCRSQETLGLEWSRVDFENRLIYLPPSKNKTGKYQSVPLNEIACEALMRRLTYRNTHCPESPWVFCKKNGTRIGSVKKSFKAACEEAEIEDFTPHDLRHTFAAWLVQNGVPLIEVRDLLRHSSVQVTEKYAHLAPDNIRAAVSILDDLSRLRHVA